MMVGERRRRLTTHQQTRTVAVPSARGWSSTVTVSRSFNLTVSDGGSCSLAVNGEKILELAKKAGFLYETQEPTEQRRLLEAVLSACASNRGSLTPTQRKPYDLFAMGNETGNWRGGWDEFRNWLHISASSR